MIFRNSEKFNGIAFVCYLDVLGFSDDVLNNWGKTPSPLEKILSIKRKMLAFDELKAYDIKATEGTLKLVPSIKTISDSITICFGFFDKNSVVELEIISELEAVLLGISNSWSTAIMNGYTIRGAIDFGEVYWDKNDLIGPAFINAYRLESEVAKSSRIIISSRINKLFYDLVNNKKDIFTALSVNFRKDVDGYIIVDPNIIYKTDDERNELIEKLKKSRDATSGIVREKYNPLISMLSEGIRIGLKDSDIGSY